MLFPRFAHLALILFICVALVSCGKTKALDEQSSSLLGCWSGDDFQPVLGQTTMWLMERRSDGTFRVEFQPKDGKLQIEEGTWRHKGSSYTTATSEINGKLVDASNPIYADEYEIKLLANGFMEYHHTRMKVNFKARKVECGNSLDGRQAPVSK